MVAVYVIVIVWQQITGWLEVSIVDYVVCDMTTKNNLRLKKNKLHISLKTPPKHLGVTLFARLQLLQRNERHDLFQLICFS